MWRFSCLAGLGIWAIAFPAISATPPDPCGGASGLLAVLDRPTVGDSACVVAPGHSVVELGLTQGPRITGGQEIQLPLAALRFGLGSHRELVWLPPSAIRQSGPGNAGSGATASVLGLKQQFLTRRHTLLSGETLVTLPSGTDAYGAAGAGLAVNGLFSQDLPAEFGMALQLGFSSQAAPKAQGGTRYASALADLVFTRQFNPRTQLYLEFTGLSHSGPGQGSALNTDGGLQFLITRDLEVDIEAGRQLHGTLGDLSRYWGIGLGLAL